MILKIKEIRTEEEYEEALQKAEELMNAEVASEEAEELIELGIEINKYEDKYYPMGD